MFTSDHQTNARIGLLIGLHIAVGLTMAVIAAYYPSAQWPIWIELAYLGLLSSQMLLLGIALGFANAKWWTKLLGLIAGTCWLIFLARAPSPYARIQDMGALILAPLLVIACASLLCRYWLAAIQKRDSWPVEPIGNDLQFTLRSMIGFTVTIALLLGLGRLIREGDARGAEIAITVAVITLVAVLAAAMLVWACLGPGRIVVRLPTALVGVVAAGLIFPYYIGGPTWRYAIWPALMLTVFILVAASLGVIRSCGYRLVSIWQKEL